MSSFIQQHKFSLIAFLATSVAVTSVWASPPASRPIRKSESNETTSQSLSTYALKKLRYSKQQPTAQTNRPFKRQQTAQVTQNKRPIIKQAYTAPKNHSAQYQSNSQTLRRVKTAPQLSRVPQTQHNTKRPSLFGTVQDRLQTVAGTNQPQAQPQQNSNIQSELQKLYAENGKVMPPQPTHRPQKVNTPQNQASPSNQANSSPGLSRFSSPFKSAHKNRPTPANSGRRRTVQAVPNTAQAQNAPPKKNAFKRFFGNFKLGRKKQSEPPAELAAPNAQPTRPQTNVAAGLAPNTRKQITRPQANTITANPIQPQLKAQVIKKPFAQQEVVIESVKTPKLKIAPQQELILEEDTFEAPQVKQIPEELLVQEPGRVDLDLNNAWGEEGEEDFEDMGEVVLDLIQETETKSVQLTAPIQNNFAPEEPNFANSEEPIQLKIDAAEGTTTVQLEEPAAEIKVETVETESPFLLDEVAETAEEIDDDLFEEELPIQVKTARKVELFQEAPKAVQATQTRKKTIINLVPQEPATLNAEIVGSSAAPIKKVMPTPNNDIQDITKPELATGIIDVANTEKAPGMGRYCPHTLRNELRLVEGLPQFRAIYNSKVYWFASHEAKTMFQNNPELYTPVNNGIDSVLQASFDYRTEGTALHSLWYRGRLYLFASDKTKESFRLTPQNYAYQDSK